MEVLGKRQIGSTISYFTKGDLVLIGSNLSHCGLTNENTRNEYEIVVQFCQIFRTHIWKTPEMKKITDLLDASKVELCLVNRLKIFRK